MDIAAAKPSTSPELPGTTTHTEKDSSLWDPTHPKCHPKATNCKLPTANPVQSSLAYPTSPKAYQDAVLCCAAAAASELRRSCSNATRPSQPPPLKTGQPYTLPLLREVQVDDQPRGWEFFRNSNSRLQVGSLTSKLKCGFHTHKQGSFYSLASWISKFPSDNLPDLLGADARHRLKNGCKLQAFPQQAPNFFPYYISPRLQVINEKIYCIQ